MEMPSCDIPTKCSPLQYKEKEKEKKLIMHVMCDDNLHSDNLQSDNLQSDNLHSDNLHSDNLHSDNLHSGNLQSDNLQSDNLQSDNLHSDNLQSDNLHSDNLHSDNLQLDTCHNIITILLEIAFTHNTVNIENFGRYLIFGYTQHRLQMPKLIIIAENLYPKPTPVFALEPVPKIKNLCRQKRRKL